MPPAVLRQLVLSTAFCTVVTWVASEILELMSSGPHVKEPIWKGWFFHLRRNVLVAARSREDTALGMAMNFRRNLNIIFFQDLETF